MTSLRPFLAGIFVGIFPLILLLGFMVCFLPDFLVVGHVPKPADAIVVLGGDDDGGRLHSAMKLYDEGVAKILLLTSGNRKNWELVANRSCSGCTLEGRTVVILEKSTDTRTDAEFTLRHCFINQIRKILVVTSPYHTRRAQFVFNDIYEGSGIEVSVLSSGEYGKLIPPSGRWWSDRKTLEVIWLELGKILYWELTPFMEFQGAGGN